MKIIDTFNKIAATVSITCAGNETDMFIKDIVSRYRVMTSPEHYCGFVRVSTGMAYEVALATDSDLNGFMFEKHLENSSY